MDQNSNNRTIPSLVRTFAPEGNIHNLPCYHEGELWHSYLNRVAIENGIPDAKRLLELCSCLGPTDWTDNQRLNYECMKEASRGILKSDGDDWILTGTLFKGMSPLLLCFLGDIHTQMHIPNPILRWDIINRGDVYRLNSHTLSTECIDG